MLWFLVTVLALALPSESLVITDVKLKIRDSLAARSSLLRYWGESGTNCYRIFHGAVEGVPGLTVSGPCVP